MNRETKQRHIAMGAALADPCVAAPHGPPARLKGLTAAYSLPPSPLPHGRYTELGPEVTLTMVAPRPVPLVSRLLACRARTSRASLLAWVRSGAEVGWQNTQGGNALMVAARFGEIDTARFLVGQGAKVNVKDARGFGPLCWAVWYGHRSVAEFLRSRGATFAHTAVYSAAVQLGHLTPLMLLQHLGAPVLNGKPRAHLVTLAACYNQEAALHFLLTHGHTPHDDAWRAAVTAGHFRLATRLERALGSTWRRRLSCIWGVSHARYWWHRRQLSLV